MGLARKVRAEAAKDVARADAKGLLITIPFWLGLGFAYWLLNGIAAQQAEQAARDVGAIFLGYQVIFGPVLLFVCLGIVDCAGYLLAEDPYGGRHAAATHLWSPIFLPGFCCKATVASIRLQSTAADNFHMRFRKRDLRILRSRAPRLNRPEILG